MQKEYYINIINSSNLSGKSKWLLLQQLNNFYELEKKYKQKKHKYNVWDLVKLKKWTLLHWTYKNFKWLKDIVKGWLISWNFCNNYRNGKYLYTVAVRKLKKSCLLGEYINLYSFWCLRWYSWWTKNRKWKEIKKIISFQEKDNLLNIINNYCINTRELEQTKESRFMPSLASEFIQIGIIFDWSCGDLINYDILNPKMKLEDAKEFVHPDIWEDFFVKNRDNKDIFFTDRESAILFWIPAICIQWILVWRKYEKDEKILKKIKLLLPNVYICNLDWIVIA